MSGPELSVVCKSCGSEVSPYVTECPYCGTRLRKRAPRLEREGDEIRIHESKRDKRRRERKTRVASRPRPDLRLDARPWATIITLAAAAILVVVQRSAGLFPDDVGALIGPAGDQPWRYLSAPFVYDDLGYLAVVGMAIGIFGVAIERRLGSFATGLLILSAGTLGMLAAGAADEAGIGDFLVAAGGNGVALALFAAWFAFARAERDGQSEEPFNSRGAIAAGLVLLLLPFFEETADPIAGAVGAIVGYVLGSIAVARGAGAES